MQADLFNEHEDWKRPVAVSAGLHVLVAVALIVSTYLSGPRGQSWGESSSGSAVNANLVSSIPLPHPQEPTQNILANDSKGQTQSVPQQTVEEKTNAVPIPETSPKHRIDRTPVTPTQQNPRPTPVPQDNRIPFVQGGPVSGPYATFSASHATGGVAVQNAGDFGSRFSYYVNLVSSKVSSNWYQIEIGPNVGPHRVWVQFDIDRDGTPKNVRLEQSSGVPALDQSTIRAVERIDTFGPLPSGYSGSKVSVEFWFDYQR